MGNNLFGANISGQLAAVFAGKLLPLVLIKKRKGAAVDASNPLAGTTTIEDRYEGEGFGEAAQFLRGGKRIASGNIRVSILGDSLVGGEIEPAINDEIEIEDPKTGVVTRYLVNDLATDPDAAMHECSCSGVKP